MQRKRERHIFAILIYLVVIELFIVIEIIVLVFFYDDYTQDEKIHDSYEIIVKEVIATPEETKEEAIDKKEETVSYSFSLVEETPTSEPKEVLTTTKESAKDIAEEYAYVVAEEVPIVVEWGTDSPKEEYIGEIEEDKAEAVLIPDFHVYSEVFLAQGTLHIDGFYNKSLITFPHCVSNANICDALVLFIEKHTEESNAYSFSIDNKIITIEYDREYTEEEVADLFVLLLSFYSSLDTSPQEPKPLEIAEIAESEEPTESLILPIEATYPTTIDIAEEELFLEQDNELDYFADFYISGEDTLFFIDGIYYMDLYVNRSRRGEIAVEMRAQEPYLATTELKDYTSKELTASAYDRIFSAHGDYISLSQLEEVGVKGVFYRDDYKIELEFDIIDIPLSVISINAPTRAVGVRRSLSGAISLEPATFTLRSIYTGYLSWNLRDFNTWTYDLSLYSNNTASLFDVFLSFGYSLHYYQNKLSLSLGNYTFYRDWQKEMLRLSWGNVSTGLLSPNGTALGVSLEKSINYSDGSYIKKSPYETTIAIEKESRVEVINSDKVMYDKILSPGNYRLEDFVLYSGVNRVLVRISPLDGSSPTEIVKEFSYYAQMLYPGEFYYGLSVATGREVLSSSTAKREGTFGFTLGDKHYQYDLKNIAISANGQFGITHTLSASTAISISNNPTDRFSFNPKAKLNMELTHMNVLGTTRYNLNLSEQRLSDDSYSLPSIYARIGHQASTGWKTLSSINLGLSYTSGESITLKDGHILSLNGGISGRLGILGYSLGGYANLNLSSEKLDYYSIYSSISLALKGSVSISGNISFTGKEWKAPKASGSVYISYSFGTGDISSTISDTSIKTSANTRLPLGTMNVSLYSPGLREINKYSNIDEYSFSMGYSATTNYFSLGLGMNGDLEMKSLNGTLSLVTTSLFADGYFAMSSSIAASSLLIRQKGVLKGNAISIGYGGASSFAFLPTSFGTSIYSGLSSSRYTELTLYSVNDDSLSSPSSVSLSIPPSRNRVYTYTFTADAIYTISGIVEEMPNGSSPLYKVDIVDNRISLKPDENNYVFTDETGRFIISDLSSGLYAFDIPSDDGWILALIEVVDIEENTIMMSIYSESSKEGGYILPEQYIDCANYSYSYSLASDEFWKTVFPEALGGEI